MKEKLNWGLLSKYRTEIYGIATLMIMVFHCQNLIPVQGFLYGIFKHLNFGVDIFLIMSGMCLYFSYSKNNDYGLFMKKRCERTLIPYLAIAFFFWLWKDLIFQFELLDFLYNISGLSLFLLRIDNHLALGEPEIWYVGFIMIMYAVYPVIYKSLFSVPEKRRTVNFAVMLIIAVAGTFFIKFYAPAAYDGAEIWLTRLPAFLIGCYLGKAVKEKKPFRLFDYVLFFSFIPVKIIKSTFIDPNVSDKVTFHRYLGVFGAFIILFFIVLLLEFIKKIRILDKVITGVCLFFGNLSLEIYIIHVLIYHALLYVMPDFRTSAIFAFREKVLIYAGILVISVILAVIFNKGIGAVKGIIKAKKEKKA